jgi:hypothetical protein
LQQSLHVHEAKSVKRCVRFPRSNAPKPLSPGFIPRALAKAHPEAAVTRSSRWCRFPEPFCCPLLLDPQDPLFARVGAAYVAALRQEFGHEPPGRPSYYIADRWGPGGEGLAGPGVLFLGGWPTEVLAS